MTRVRVGVVAPDGADAVRRLEAAGVDSLWVGGHIASPNPSPEPMAWLGRLAEQSTTATIGTAALLVPLYPPALLAKQLADLDRATGGRVAVGVGVGGEHPVEFDAVGVAVGERGSRTDESIAIMRALWRGKPVTHAGRHFRFRDVRVHPAPAQAGGPPILVCGRSEAAMRRAASLGDGWMPHLMSPGRYRASLDRIGELASAAGRSLEGFERLVYVMVALDDAHEPAQRAAAAFFRSTFGRDPGEALDRLVVAGDATYVAEALAAYVEAGAQHLVLCPIHGDRAEVAERLLLAAPVVAESESGTARSAT